MKITAEIIEQINELYLKLGVKARVAKEIGCSSSTVTKYLIPNYVSKENRIENKCKIEPNEELFTAFVNLKDLSEALVLSEEEWASMAELQKGVMI